MKHLEPSLSQSLAAAYQTLARRAEKIARNEGKAVTTAYAVAAVGYESPSQFSREYRRFFRPAGGGYRAVTEMMR